MLNICITADHELFFGENYLSEQEVLIKPTYKLMEILEENNVNLTLMTDVCSIWRFRDFGINDYPDMMEEQLKYAIKNSHDVQLHLHPHWINSTFKDNKWNFDKKKYKLHDFGFESDNSSVTAKDIIKKGKEYLEKLLTEINSSYKCIAFRAGGWCLQPEEELLKNLIENNIKIDTTLYKGGYQKTETHFVDFRNLPNEINWWINPKKGINYKSKKNSSSIFEVCIGSYNKKPNIWFNKIKYKLIREKRSLGKLKKRGVSIDYKKLGRIELLKFRIKYLFNTPIIFNFQDSCKEEMIDITNYYLKKFDCLNNDYYIAMMGHPKNIFDNNLIELDKFCKEIKKNYTRKVKFINLCDVYFKVFKDS
jgi:hypothetical protein